MSHLDQHLHRLFLDHDCVVVPGLGGFVCNRQPARYEAARQEVIPPSRSILFNERLTHHDGVLAQAVAQFEGCTYDEALARLNEESKMLKQEIVSGHTVEIQYVGRLYRGAEGRIQFMADQEMERLLRSFGLQRVPLRPLSSQPLPQAKKEETPIIQLYGTDSNMPWKRLAAAIAVPIIGGAGMFFLDSWNVDDARMSAWPLSSNRAVEANYQPRMTEESVPTWEWPAETSATPLANDLNGESISALGAKSSEETPKDSPAETPTIASSQTLFMLVAGAFAVEGNAQNLAAELAGVGHASEIFWDDSKKLHIVAFSVHTEEQSARNQLFELRSQEASKNAWLKRWRSATPQQ